MPAPVRRPRIIAIVVLLLALLGNSASAPSPANAAGTAITTDTLNLRVGFLTTSNVKLVMPEGATVEIVNRSQNGYWKVVYQGVRGYAHGDYLDFSGGGGGNSGGGATGNARTTSSLNLRSGPSTSNRVLLVMPSGAGVSLTGGSSNGFLELTYQGTTGWASADYISTSGGGGSNPGSGNAGTAYTTSALNLRAEPSTGVRVLLVIPSGAAVTLTGATQNGFSGVTYGGATGWAYTEYLSSSPSDPGSGNAGVAYTTSSLNLRAEPSTGVRVLLVIPAGA
ncbi:MAG: SH3 domain-containing protein, partial [Thermomicrobiales bacterium]|nr:SH3 domain-containing protein [Thermomicrobiales bacterium]